MDHFNYRDGRLHAEEVDLSDIAEAVGTPLYVYSTATIEKHYKGFAGALADMDATVCFAVKACSNIAVIKTLADLGAGADVVSGGELSRALMAGTPADKIVFSGVGKTRDEMTRALAADVFQINVESEPELAVLNELALTMGKRAPVALRVNPDVDAKTHAKITTGKGENKFGIEWTRAREVYALANAMPGIEVLGIAVHIGSQLLDLEPFRIAYRRTRDLAAILLADGFRIERMDLGGGMGIPYEGQPTPSFEDYASIVREVVGDLGLRLMFEPGRVIMGNAGLLLTRVLYVKEGTTRGFVIVDAAMNDLARPSFYDAHHRIEPVVSPPEGDGGRAMDVVGPICETGDTFAKNRKLASVKAGDLLVLRTAGAYGATMASTYNSRPLVPEVLVKGGDFAVIRARETIVDMLSRERLPPWAKN